MTDQEMHSTEEMQQTTITQSQQTIEQLMDLQRNMAQMTLSAMRWQNTAQKQGMEMTQSMMETFPGQQFTQSMLENYLEGMQAIMPEIERAIEKGTRAAQPERGRGQQMRTGHAGGERRQQRSQPRQQYPETGEWVSPGETYGGEATGRRGGRQDEGRMQTRSTRERGHERMGPPRQGGEQRQPMQGQERERQRGGEPRSPQQQERAGRGQERPREQYSQRIEPGERGREERGRRQPVSQGGGGQPRQQREAESESESEGMAQSDMDVSPDRTPEADEEQESDQE